MTFKATDLQTMLPQYSQAVPRNSSASKICLRVFIPILVYKFKHTLTRLLSVLSIPIEWAQVSRKPRLIYYSSQLLTKLKSVSLSSDTCGCLNVSSLTFFDKPHFLQLTENSENPFKKAIKRLWLIYGLTTHAVVTLSSLWMALHDALGDSREFSYCRLSSCKVAGLPCCEVSGSRVHSYSLVK